jgi:hypothetical protein
MKTKISRITQRPTVRKTESGARLRRMTSHEFRFALLLCHRTKRGSIERQSMAHCLRKAIGKRYDPSKIV